MLNDVGSLCTNEAMMLMADVSYLINWLIRLLTLRKDSMTKFGLIAEDQFQQFREIGVDHVPRSFNARVHDPVKRPQNSLKRSGSTENNAI